MIPPSQRINLPKCSWCSVFEKRRYSTVWTLIPNPSNFEQKYEIVIRKVWAHRGQTSALNERFAPPHDLVFIQKPNINIGANAILEPQMKFFWIPVELLLWWYRLRVVLSMVVLPPLMRFCLPRNRKSKFMSIGFQNTYQTKNSKYPYEYPTNDTDLEWCFQWSFCHPLCASVYLEIENQHLCQLGFRKYVKPRIPGIHLNTRMTIQAQSGAFNDRFATPHDLVFIQNLNINIWVQLDFGT